MSANATLHTDNTVEIRLSGEIDFANADELRTQLSWALGQLPTGVALDLQDLDYLDSAGIGEIMRAQRLLGARGLVLSVRGANPTIRNLFEIMGLHLIVHLEPLPVAEPR